MHKISMVLVSFFLISSAGYTQTQELVNIRSKFVEESQKLSDLLKGTKDVVLVNSMWDACILAVTQLDAYFAMAGIVNARNAQMSKEAVDYLISWLNRIKRTNNSNIESLSDTSQAIEAKTVVRMKRLKGYFTQMNDLIDKELNRINILKQLLSSLENDEKILEKALQLSEKWLEWRLAGGLRIFQFIKTKPYLTEEFFFTKLKNALLSLKDEEFKKLDWMALKKEYLIHACKVQLQYGLGILMLLAFGSFFRKPMAKNQEISPRYLYFWLLLSREIKKRASKREKLPWNVYFDGLPHWTEWKKSMVDKLTDGNLKSIIENAREEMNYSKNEINLFLDFKKIMD